MILEQQKSIALVSATSTVVARSTACCVDGSPYSVRFKAGSSMKHSTARLIKAKTCVVLGSRAASSTHAKMAALRESVCQGKGPT